MGSWSMLRGEDVYEMGSETDDEMTDDVEGDSEEDDGKQSIIRVREGLLMNSSTQSWDECTVRGLL